MVQTDIRGPEYTLLLGLYEFLGFTLTITPDKRFLLLALNGQIVEKLSVHTTVKQIQERCKIKVSRK